jgi:CO dehydrogenase maturation factor
MKTARIAAVESVRQPLCGKRILVCGKGGSGKSTLVALLATLLQRKAYDVMVLDGDASNPEGLIRLLFGVGAEQGPKPLVEFFGGLAAVTCPVDDPSPLTRIDDVRPVPDKPIDVLNEIQPEFYLRRGRMTLLQAGKIENYGQGCDGPLEKVVRDFMIAGEAVNLIDVKAGVEHFGRRIADRMDLILVVLDATLESVSIAHRVDRFCKQGGIDTYGLIFNKIDSEATRDLLLDNLGDLKNKIIGSLSYDQDLVRAGLLGELPELGKSVDAVAQVVERLEEMVSGR